MIFPSEFINNIYYWPVFSRVRIIFTTDLEPLESKCYLRNTSISTHLLLNTLRGPFRGLSLGPSFSSFILTTTMFADDTKCFRAIRSPNDIKSKMLRAYSLNGFKKSPVCSRLWCQDTTSRTLFPKQTRCWVSLEGTVLTAFHTPFKRHYVSLMRSHLNYAS